MRSAGSPAHKLPSALAAARSATRSDAGGYGRWFLQLQGEFTLEGTATGIPIADHGNGFFETYVRREPAPEKSGN